MKFLSTVEEIAEISPICSTMVAREMGTMVIIAVTRRLVLMLPPVNTTYGENTGVLTLSKVYDPLVVELAAFFAMFFSVSPKLAACISAIPTPVVGGISLVLYGMISAVGVRNVVENKIDFGKARNVIIAAIILVLSIGVTYSAAGSIVIPCGQIVISLSGLAVGSLVGIILNAVLPGKDYVFEDNPTATQSKNEMIKPEPVNKPSSNKSHNKKKKK